MPPPDLGGEHRRPDRGLPWWGFVLVLALGAAAVIAGIYVTFSAGAVEDKAEQLPVVTEQRDAAAGRAADLGRQVLDACQRGDVVQSPDGRDLCALAARVQAEPVPPVAGVPGERGEPGPAPTPDQLRAIVAEYMAANPPRPGEPGRPPTPAEVAAAVSQHLIANPPRPGRPPTAAEIESAVATYFATNPVRDGVDGAPGAPGAPGAQGEQGAPGERGERGPGPTEDEIRAAVAAELAENPPPAGPTCVDGTTLQAVQFVDGQSGLACVFDDQPVEQQPTTTTEPDASEGG